jgi:2,3-bisphosphoglycerate-dependent phosphoglycerate mutase
MKKTSGGGNYSTVGHRDMRGSSTLYLIRHAQSMPKQSELFSQWGLSLFGMRQAAALAVLLEPLGIARVYSSPFVRSIETAKPLADNIGVNICMVDGLRERQPIIDKGLPLGAEWYQAWCHAWEDFAFAPPGCESSTAAQERIVQAIDGIVQKGASVAAVFTHGHVMALFLNAVTGGMFSREDAERLTNPDVMRVEWKDGEFSWDRDFRLPGLEKIRTQHGETPLEKTAISQR